MNPIDPSSEPVDFSPPGAEPPAGLEPSPPAPEPPAFPPEPPPFPPQPPRPREPFWDYLDLTVFALLVVVSLVAALAITLIFFGKLGMAYKLLLPQLLWYVLAFGALKILLWLRYNQPFWRSLGWRAIPIPAAMGALFLGPVLAITLGLLGSALRSPQIELPLQEMLGSPVSTALLGCVVVILGPVCEELAFRGFMMPLLIRSLGAAGGIILTGVVFGCAHGYEYQWSWQYMLLISIVGCVLGWAKYKTGSTVTSAFMHSTFNLTQFVAFLVQNRTL